MMKNRKFMASVVAAALFVGVAGTALANTVSTGVYGPVSGIGEGMPAAEVKQKLESAGVKNIEDVQQSYAAGSIAVLLGAGVYTPPSTGEVNPKQQLNAASGVAVFAKVLGIASRTATDEQALAAAKSGGLVDNSVTADKPLTRMEVAKLLATALGVEPRATVGNFPFEDAEGLSIADMRLLGALYDLGIFKGYDDGTFKPGEVLTVEQLAVLIDRILGAE